MRNRFVIGAVLLAVALAASTWFWPARTLRQTLAPESSPSTDAAAASAARPELAEPGDESRQSAAEEEATEIETSNVSTSILTGWAKDVTLSAEVRVLVRSDLTGEPMRDVRILLWPDPKDNGFIKDG